MAARPSREQVAAYGAEATRRLSTILSERLVAAYLTGSYALDDWEPATSDVDLFVVVERPLSVAEADAIVDALRSEVLPVPGRQLELTLVTRAAVRRVLRRPRLELNLDSAPGRLLVHRSTARPDSHWLTLDAELARRCGVPLLGPTADQLIAPRPEAWLRQAQIAGLEWYARHEPRSHQRVLHVCRAWAFGVDGLLFGKGPAAAWALRRGADAALIEAALRMRRGAPPIELPLEIVDELADHARASLAG